MLSLFEGPDLDLKWSQQLASKFDIGVVKFSESGENLGVLGQTWESESNMTLMMFNVNNGSLMASSSFNASVSDYFYSTRIFVQDLSPPSIIFHGFLMTPANKVEYLLARFVADLSNSTIKTAWVMNESPSLNKIFDDMVIGVYNEADGSFYSRTGLLSNNIY